MKKILKKIKRILTGHGGNSNSYDPYKKEKAPVIELSELISSDVERFRHNLEETEKSFCVTYAESDDELKSISLQLKQRLNADSADSDLSREMVRVDNTSLDAMVKDELNVIKLLVANGQVVKVSDSTLKLLCGPISTNTITEDSPASLLKFFPRFIVKRLNELYSRRTINEVLEMAINGKKYDVFLDEFVQNGTCYRLIKALKVGKTDTEV